MKPIPETKRKHIHLRGSSVRTKAWWLGTPEQDAEPVITADTLWTVAPKPPQPPKSNTHEGAW